MTTEPFLNSLARTPIIAVIRARTAEDYAPIIDALVAGGVRTIEVTLTTPGTLQILGRLRDRVGGAATVGVGTIRTTSDAQRAIEEGAEFLVSPHVDPEIVRLAVTASVPVFPGAFTPTEVSAALRAGATAVKIFPASQTSPSMAGQLRGPFPELEFLPSGGIGLDDVRPWLLAGASAVCVGSPLIGAPGTEPDEITARAKAYIAAARQT